MPNEKQNQSPVNKMSLDELRIKVAELCGFTNLKEELDWGWELCGDRDGKRLPVPDFPRDLNACTELLRIVIAKGWDVEIRNNRRSEPWTCLFWKDGRCKAAHENELAAAICKNFIATMEDKT